MNTYYRVNYSWTNGCYSSTVFDTKKEAINEARNMAKNAEVLIDTIEVLKYISIRVPFRTLKAKKATVKKNEKISLFC